jgi:hypothetical protein
LFYISHLYILLKTVVRAASDRSREMRVISTMFLGLLLVGCSMTAKDGAPIVREGPLPGDGSMIGTIRELENPGSTYKHREAIDDPTTK